MSLHCRFLHMSAYFTHAYAANDNFLIGPVAQRLEQGTHNPLVVGSNPTGPTSLRLSAAKAEALTPQLYFLA